MTVRRVVLTEWADRDIDDQFEFIARDNPTAAVRFLTAIEETADLLAQVPSIGKPRRFRRTNLRGLRSRAVTGFSSVLVFYRPIDDGIEVVRLLHAARDLGRALSQEGKP